METADALSSAPLPAAHLSMRAAPSRQAPVH